MSAGWREAAWVALFLSVFLVAGTFSLQGDAATYDETAHLPAGFTYLDRGDFRLNPEHPPLAKAWAALPLWIAGLPDPDYASKAWTESNQWVFGFELLNGPREEATRRDPRRLLVPARLMMLLAGAGLALLCYFWARSLWGPRGGWISLAAFALSPTMLAHSRDRKSVV